MPKILIADDHSLVRKGLIMVVNENVPNSDIDLAINGEEVLHAVKNVKYDLLILDMNFPDIGSFRLYEQVRVFDEDLKIIIYSMNSEQAYALRYLQLGAYGYVEKSAPDAIIIKAIHRVLDGKRFFGEDIMENMALAFRNNKEKSVKNPFEKLSVREMEICMYLAKGLGVTKVSELLNLHTSTIATLKSRIFSKLEVETVFELTDKARTYNIIQ